MSNVESSLDIAVGNQTACDIKELVTNLTVPGGWASNDGSNITFHLVNQIIKEIESSDFCLTVRLPLVLTSLGHPPISNICNFVRKIRNKVSRADRVGLHILAEPATAVNPVFRIGNNCDASGITEEWLHDVNAEPLAVKLTNKHVLELLAYKNDSCHGFTYDAAGLWIQKLCSLDKAPNPHTLRSHWLSLLKQHQTLTSKNDLNARHAFHQQIYQPPKCVRNADTLLEDMIMKLQINMDVLQNAYVHQINSMEQLKNDNKTLVNSKQDAIRLKRETTIENKRLMKLNKDLQDCNDFLLNELEGTCRSYDTVNAKRTIARRDRQLDKQVEQIEEEKEKVAMLTVVNEKLDDKLSKLSKQMAIDKKRLQNKCNYLKQKSDRLTNNDLRTELQEKIDCLQEESHDLKCQLAEVTDTDEIKSFQNGKYNDEVRLVCYELLSCGIGTKHVSNVIRTVLKTLGGVNIGRLPKPTLVKYMATQSGLLAKVAAVAAIESSEGFTTLHSDGTSRQNQGMRKKYVNYLVSTDSGIVATGLQDHHSADSAAQLEGTQTMFQELLNIHEDNATEKGKRINMLIYKNKNLMQDRSSVMKQFAEQYETWRESILPTIVENWNEINETTKQDMGRVNDAYCLAHPILTFQEVSDKATHEWEIIETDDGKIGREKVTIWNRKESATICAVRSMCKAFGTEADEAAGHPNQFQGHLGDRKCHLQGFRGNRFNSPFVNATAAYFHYQDAINYISSLGSSKNLLLRCVEADMKDGIIVTGMRALGLIETQITTPYMKLSESSILFVNVGPYMTQLRDKLKEWSEDPTALLNGTAALFTEFAPKQDELYQKLFEEVSQDMEEMTHILVSILCAAMLVVVERQLVDHLPGGRFFNPTSKICKEMATTPLDNLSAERLFASMDRLQKRMPNANTITMEGILLWTQNKTADYLKMIPSEEKKQLMDLARKRTPAILKAYRERKAEIKNHYRMLQQSKEREKNEKLLRDAEAKDHIIETVMKEGGPCKSNQDISTRLSSKNTIASQRVFLLNQIKYYKALHDFPGLDKTCFYQQSKGIKLSLQELQCNLEKIINFRATLSSTNEPNQQQPQQREKSQQLQQLKRKYIDKAQSQSQENTNKRIKKSCFPGDCIIGKRVRHLWVLNGKDMWCKGTVLRKSTEMDVLTIDPDDEQHLGQETFYTLRYDLWRGQEFSYPLKREWEDRCIQLM